MVKKKKRKLSRLHPLFVPLGIEKIVTLCGQIFGKVGKIERALAAGDQAEGPYRYFVAYYFDHNGVKGVTNTFVDRDTPIVNSDDIASIEASVPLIFVRVINFILLDPVK